VIVCSYCGRPNDDGRLFCENPDCGALLEWSAGKGESDPARREAPTEVIAAGGVTATAAPPASTPPAEPKGPSPRKPAPEFLPPPSTRLERDASPQVGQVVCPRCGAGNLEHVNFCRRCGSALASAPVVMPTWWHRALRRRPPAAAGERQRWVRTRPRPPREDLARSAFIGLAALAVAAVLALGALLAWRAGAKDAATGAYDAVRGTLFPRYEPVRPIADRASSHRKGHPADAAFDQDVNTFWVPNGRRRRTGARLIARFEPDTDLAKVGIFGGDPVAKELVPETVQLAFMRRGAKPPRRWQVVAIETVRLEDKPGFQRHDLDVDGIERVVMTSRKTYRSDAPHASAAVTEVEFFRRK